MIYRIGKEYKEAFDSIFDLYGPDGLLSDDRSITVGASGGRREIRTTSNTFVYDERAAKLESGDGKQTIGKDGASWFGALRRGATGENNAADWTGLIESVARAYHKRYSLLEFEQSGARSEREAADDIRKIGNVVSRFFPGRQVRIGRMREAQANNIYGVTFLAGLSSVGESVPVLLKMYFRSVTRRGRKQLVPIAGEEAEQIDRNIIANIGDDGGQVSGSGKVASGMIKDVLGELNNVLSAGNAADYIVLAGKPDEEVVEDMVRNGPCGVVTIVVKTVKVLGISHVIWTDAVYNVEFEGKQALRAVIGMSGTLRLVCANCGEQLVSGNVIRIPAEGGTQTVVIDLDRADLGLSAKDAEAAEATMKGHIAKKECRINAREGMKCERVVCDGQLLTLTGADGKKTSVCKDCPHEECTFRKQDGAVALTKDLAFVRDAMTLTDASAAHKCACCGRQFEVLHGDGVCEFCHDAIMVAAAGTKSADSDAREAASAAKKKYVRFSSVLSPARRLAGVGRGKFCFEAEDILLFVLGRKIYILDKSAAGEKGYIDPPRYAGEGRGMSGRRRMR